MPCDGGLPASRSCVAPEVSSRHLLGDVEKLNGKIANIRRGSNEESADAETALFT